MLFTLPALFIALSLLFKNAFNVGFFSDDFAFFAVSRISSPLEIFNFFLPGKPFFYRPIPSELFYTIIRAFNYNSTVGHMISFITFFIGLYFLYQVLIITTKNKILSTIILLLYSLHFTHVFQLYALATYQEIALFTFLTASFYFFLKERYITSALLFVAALMSKEIALFYPVVILAYFFLYQRSDLKRIKTPLVLFFILSISFALIYHLSINQVSQLEFYKIHLSPRLIFNNTLWYGLWSIGFPSTMPGYFPSLLGKPVEEFYKLFDDSNFKTYFYTLLTYCIVLLLTAVVMIWQKRKQILPILIFIGFTLFSFLLFMAPALPIIHRWMVRLTVPLLFLSLLQGYVLYFLFKTKHYLGKIVLVILVISYALFNYTGTLYHEQISQYFQETRIIDRAEQVLELNRTEIIQKRNIYFTDDPTVKSNPYLTSEKLFTSFSDQHFLIYFFPDQQIKAYYEFKGDTPPANAYIIRSLDLLQ